MGGNHQTYGYSGLVTVACYSNLTHLSPKKGTAEAAFGCTRGIVGDRLDVFLHHLAIDQGWLGRSLWQTWVSLTKTIGFRYMFKYLQCWVMAQVPSHRLEPPFKKKYIYIYVYLYTYTVLREQVTSWESDPIKYPGKTKSPDCRVVVGFVQHRRLHRTTLWLWVMAKTSM